VERLTATGGRPSVALEQVTKRFGDFPAVRDLSLEIAQGEFFTLLGPSGCGKTTTLRMVAGFEDPSAGRILIDGVDVAGLPPFKRPTNTVFQSYALFPHLSVEDNVAFGLRRKGVRKEEARRRVREELERVGLSVEAKRKPRQLSGGQQQRVALARALINLPTVLLLDEPLGALDLKLRKGLQLELKRIQRDVGITFVYVTHDQEEALSVGDRIVVMHEGRIEQVADPFTISNLPENVQVAAFMGDNNIFEGTVTAHEGERVSIDGGEAELRVLAPESDAAVGQPAAVSVRASAVQVGGRERAEPAPGRDRGRRVPRRPRQAPPVRGRTAARRQGPRRPLSAVPGEGRQQRPAVLEGGGCPSPPGLKAARGSTSRRSSRPSRSSASGRPRRWRSARRSGRARGAAGRSRRPPGRRPAPCGSSSSSLRPSS
jgi:spermidine/putrescine transport system ATP-binding protein